MLLIRSFLFNVVMFGLMLVMGIILAPLAAWSAAGAFWSVQTYCRITLRLLSVMCGLKTEIRGPVPSGDVLICSKHQSFLDIIILSATLPRAKFIMKKELRWAPVLGLYALRMGSTPVHRGKKGKAMQQMVRRAAKNAEEASQLIIYPQGTRVAPGAQRPYKIGAGALYERFGNPCIPVATNAGVFWGRNTVYRRPGLAVIEFLPEIPSGLPIHDFMERIETVIETRSDALMVEAGFMPESAAVPMAGARDG
ncbi:MAG: lysophospholipid acyltransferase family protein [Pseudomonadota bacterium]